MDIKMGKINNRPEIKTDNIVRLYSDGLSIIKIAEHLGCSGTLVAHRLKKTNVSMRRCGHNGFPLASNPNWKGGEVDDNGYIRIMLPLDHPFASMRDSKGYVRRSRLVMAEHLGRPLLRTEIVHHRDENKLRDDIENLDLLASQSDHMKEHMNPERARRMQKKQQKAFMFANGYPHE